MLSQCINVGSLDQSNKSDNSFLNQTTSLLTSNAAMYSASALLKAIYSCFCLTHETMEDPKLKHSPVVLLPSCSLPPQSKFVYPIKWTSFLLAYFRQYWVDPCRYLKMCLPAIQWPCFGSAWNWLRIFTTKHMYIQVFTKYISEPINFLYLIGSTTLDWELLSLFKFVIMGVIIGLQSIMSNLFNITYDPWPR